MNHKLIVEKECSKKIRTRGKKHREIRKIEGQRRRLKIGLPSRKERIQKGKREKRRKKTRKKERQRRRKPREKIDVIGKRGAKDNRR